jgi:hypothetical protein
MGHSGGQDVLDKNPMCCVYHNQTPYIFARRISTVTLFIIIFIIDFKLTGLKIETYIKVQRWEVYSLWKKQFIKIKNHKLED